MKHRKTFLGVGWKFPPSFDKRFGSVMLVSEEEDIMESLQILLSTKPGERVMLPQYGCNLDAFLFRIIDSTLINEIREKIEYAILYFEPRIFINQIEIKPDPATEGLLLINLLYTIRKTNMRSNMVYPFYILEGNQVRYKPADV